jgi:hypothetical protein
VLTKRSTSVASGKWYMINQRAPPSHRKKVGSRRDKEQSGSCELPHTHSRQSRRILGRGAADDGSKAQASLSTSMRLALNFGS